MEKPGRARVQEVGLEVGVGLAKVSPTIAGERTHELVLRELDDVTARAVLSEPARQLRVTWAPAALPDGRWATGP